jgi:hypothetical protein
MIAGRAHGYQNLSIPVRTSALSSFLELFVVVLSGLPLCALAAWRLEYASSATGLGLAVLAFVLEIGALHPGILNQVLVWTRHNRPTLALTYRQTLRWAFIYTLVWLVSGTGLYLTALLFEPANLASLPLYVGVWVAASLISYLTLLSPSGLGIKELSLTFLLSLFIAEPLPLLIALAIRLVWTIYDIVAGIAALLLRRQRVQSRG